MADLKSRFRTNYFRISPDKNDTFMSIMKNANITEANNMLWTRPGAALPPAYAFGSENGDLSNLIDGIYLLRKKYPDCPAPGISESYGKYNNRLENWAKTHDINLDAYQTDKAMENAVSEFLGDLQDTIAENEAIVIQTISYENLKYLWADAMIITRNGKRYVSLDEVINEELEKRIQKPYKINLYN